nr:DNA helicase [Tanacetum cinerariifolium]
MLCLRQRFNLAFEVALVQKSGLAPVVKEPVMFDRIGDHVEITGTSSDVEQKVKTPVEKGIRFLLKVFSTPVLAEIPPNRHCIPILTVFECFRNMPAAKMTRRLIWIWVTVINNVATVDVCFGTTNNSKAVITLWKQSTIYTVEEENFTCHRCLYVYDTRDELSNRMHHFGGLDESILNPNIVEGLIHVLDEHNGLLRLLRTVRDRCNVGDIPSFKIRLYNMGGVRGYELLTANVLGAIVFENRPRIRIDFDIIIKFRGGPPQRINKLHQSYMSLQFPLLFIFGQPRGDREEIADGSKIMLSNTFTGGPRVFEQKVEDFLRFLKEVKTFGYVSTVLYTIEFQKKGLPHCHMLLWIESRNTLKDGTHIHEYISAEIPGPVQDPKAGQILNVHLNDMQRINFRKRDRTLRDLMNAPNVLFGGKTIVLGGDFCQTLPVKKGVKKEELIATSIAESYLWCHFRIYTLKENMRLQRSGLTNEERKRSKTFAKWLLDVGNGKIGEPEEEEDQDSSWITIPPEYSVNNDEKSLSRLINFIYDDTTLKTPNAGSLQEKVIVCSKNATADDVNAKILSNIEGQRKIYLSNDEVILMGSETSETELLYLTEYLNTITFLGFPPHELELNVGSPIMLPRNVNLLGGLCNGTRMIVR